MRACVDACALARVRSRGDIPPSAMTSSVAPSWLPVPCRRSAADACCRIILLPWCSWPACATPRASSRRGTHGQMCAWLTCSWRWSSQSERRVSTQRMTSPHAAQARTRGVHAQTCAPIRRPPRAPCIPALRLCCDAWERGCMRALPLTTHAAAWTVLWCGQRCGVDSAVVWTALWRGQRCGVDSSRLCSTTWCPPPVQPAFELSLLVPLPSIPPH
eukprot:364885-Chlamydomonas_euryale.AAC.1